MSGIQVKKYPPYMGNDPYIFVSFSRKDTSAVLPVLKRLSERNVRFYYVHAEGRDAAEAELIQQRIRDASFMVFFATEHSSDENDAQKGFAQYFESLCKAQKNDTAIPEEKKKHFIILHYGFHRSEMLDYGFSSVPSETTVSGDRTGEKAENAIIHASGFTQDFIGSEKQPGYKKIFLILVILAVLFSAGLAAFLGISRAAAEKKAAELAARVPVSDPVVAEAAEEAVRRLGYEKLDKGNVSAVEELQFDTVPGSTKDLPLFPNLKQITVPQEIAAELLQLTDGHYEIVLDKGGK